MIKYITCRFRKKQNFNECQYFKKLKNETECLYYQSIRRSCINQNIVEIEILKCAAEIIKKDQTKMELLEKIIFSNI